MMDLKNSVSNGILALYHEDKTFKNGRFCNLSSSCSPVDTFIGQEKEKMRQIILKHDSVVRNQIQELHRLYRRQRDLMSELERREFCKRPLSSDTPKASSFLSLTPCEDAQKSTHNIADIPLAGLSYGIIQPHLSFVQGKRACNAFSSHDGVQLKGDYLKSKCNNFQRKGFDLELPAKVCTDNEEKQLEEKKICRVAGTESYLLGRNGDTNLSTGSGLDSNCNGDSLRLKVFLSSAHNLADLNKPIWDEVTPTANSVSSVDGSTRLCGDMQKQEIFVNPISGLQFWPQDFLQRGTGEKDRNIELNHKHSRIDKSTNGKTRYDDHSSFDGISDNHTPTLTGSLQFEPQKAKKTITLTISDHGSLAPQKARTNFAVAISDRNHIRAADTSYSSSLHLCNQRSAGVKCKPFSTTLNTLSQKVASFQTNSCLHTLVPTTEKPSNWRIHFNGDEMHSSNNLRSPSSRSEVSHQDALCNGSQSDVKKLHACLDLNSYPHPQQHSAYADSENAHCSGAQTKVKEVISQMSMDTLRNHSKQIFNKVTMTNGPFLDLASPTCGFEFGSKKVDDSVSLSSTKSMGFPIVNAPQISKYVTPSRSPSKPTYCASNLDTSGASADDDAKSVCQVQVMGSFAENGLSNSVSGLRHQIDLNLSLSDEEDPSPPCLPQAVMKIATEMNLEAPGVLESNSAVPADELDHSEKVNGIGSKELLDDTREHKEELVRVAAEAIVDISLSQMEVADPSCQLQDASSADCLLWLADVISSSEFSANGSKETKCLSNGDDACDDKTNPEDMDDFEILTLKLEDLKEQECLWKPYNSEHMNDEEILGTPVPQQTRKGQARRGRQRKDFQNVLPGLVTLSRYEILEDLQVIEDMVKACGFTWQSSHSKRGAAKNGRRRRRSGGFTPPRTTSAVRLPKVQHPTYRQLELNDKCLTGWGKRTKRLPRQRCSTGSHTPFLECRFAN